KTVKSISMKQVLAIISATITQLLGMAWCIHICTIGIRGSLTPVGIGMSAIQPEVQTAMSGASFRGVLHSLKVVSTVSSGSQLALTECHLPGHQLNMAFGRSFSAECR